MRPRRIVCVAAALFVAASSVAQAAAQHGYFQSNGVRLHYLTDGEGEPVVLIHGFAASAYVNWVMPGVFDNLARQYRVIALDNRGHGMSDKPHDARYGMEMVEDVVRLLDHLKIKKAHIVGYSMGGFITGKLISLYPDRVLSATLGGAGWGREDDDHSVLDQLAKSLDEGKGIVPLMKALRPPGGRVATDEELRVKNQFVMLANDQKALAACVRGFLALAVPRAALQKNTLPVLCLIGSIDPLKDKVDPMVGVMQHLKVVVIDGEDHMSTFRSPKFIEALRDFLKANSAQPVAARP